MNGSNVFTNRKELVKQSIMQGGASAITKSASKVTFDLSLPSGFDQQHRAFTNIAGTHNANNVKTGLNTVDNPITKGVKSLTALQVHNQLTASKSSLSPSKNTNRSQQSGESRPQNASEFKVAESDRRIKMKEASGTNHAYILHKP